MVSPPRVWIAVDYSPPDRFQSCFDSAYEARQALRDVGRPAYLFSVRKPLDFLRPGGMDVVYPIAETCRERPGDAVGLRRVARERNVPVVGSPWIVVETASDKLRARAVMAGAGYVVPRGHALVHGADLEQAVPVMLASPGVPAVAKPATARGGSMDVEYLPDEGALRWRVRRFLAARPSPPLLLEEYVAGTEVTTWVLERDGEYCTETLEIDKEGPLFSRNNKTGWRREGLHYDDRYPAVVVHRPPRLDRRSLSAVDDAAIGLHRLFNAVGYSRTDMVVRDGQPVILEINTTPRLRAESALGMSELMKDGFGALLTALVDDAVARSQPANASIGRPVAAPPSA